MINRRQLVAGVAAAAVAPRGAFASGGSRDPYPRSRYDLAVVIDALGGLGEFNPDAPDDAPLSARALQDARDSGVTVINFTVNDVGNGPNRFKSCVKSIADLEHEIAKHPDALKKVVHGGDIKIAKSTRRLGIVYGCQDTTMLEAVHGYGLWRLLNHVVILKEVC